MKLSKKRFTPVEIASGGAIIVLLAAIVWLTIINPPAKRMARLCVNNLRMIDAAKDAYLLESSNRPPPDLMALVTNNYFRKTPVCPAGGRYIVGGIGVDPTCSIGGRHALPRF